jgi:two-component system, cell cycle sensor histidine kinase and response regulator CckA
VLTNQLLTFGRKQVFQPIVLDLNTAVMKTEKMMHSILGEGVKISIDCAASPLPVKIDPHYLEQAILNLTINARDAMPKGGKLLLETQKLALDDSFAERHGGITPGEYALFAVTDTGVGMSEEVKAHVFEPFYTTKEIGKGTGLGLSAVYGIVVQSHGYIWVYSEPGRGTTFKIYLPICAQQVSTIQSPQRAAPALTGSGTILLVEDDGAVRKLLVEVLSSLGYRILEASSGHEALNIKGLDTQDIRLLITDVIMPGMTGRELADKLKAKAPGLVVLYISGYTENVIASRGILEPGLAFLQKPFTPSGLAQKVKELLQPHSDP